jgi:hypothetical protein
MNKREWLISQGLAKASRGKFSKEAELAWSKHTGQPVVESPVRHSESLIELDGPPATPETELPRDGFHLAKVPEVKPIIRQETEAYSIDAEGRIVAHGTCSNCSYQINRCDCVPGPSGPKYLPKQTAYLVKS